MDRTCSLLGRTFWSLIAIRRQGSRRFVGSFLVDSAAKQRTATIPRLSWPPQRGRVAMKLIDLSHTIEHQMITYPGLPGPVIGDHLTREQSRSHYTGGTEFHIGKIEMVANTGTYLDSPAHRYREGDDLAGLELEALADRPAVVVRARDRAARGIDRASFARLDVRGKAVLVDTGWSRHWRTPQYGAGHPFLTADAAQHLVSAGAKLVGIDSLNIDDTADGLRPVHTALLAARIPVVEHLTALEQLPAGDLRFFAVPVKVKGLGTFPVRAFAIVG